MTCDQVRDLLVDDVFGTSEPDVASHLRGCAGCRAEARALDQGMATFIAAIPEVEPPPGSRAEVLGVLQDEWTQRPAGSTASHGTLRWISAAAGIAAALLLVASFAWGLTSWHSAKTNAAAAGKYERFLSTLGGKELREGALQATGSHPFEGSAVVYDSMEGRSWVLLIARAPGYQGEARVTLSSPTDTLTLPTLEVQSNGEAYSVFVTPTDLSTFDRVQVTARDGSVIASGTID